MPINRIQLVPPFELRRTLPQNYHESDQEYFCREILRKCAGVNAIECTSTLLDVHKGVLIDNWSVCQESLVSPSLLQSYGLGYILRTKLRSASKLNSGPYLLAHTSYCQGYGHWMSDTIPRLYVSRNRLKDHKLLLPSTYTHRFYLDSLAPFGITEHCQIQYVDKPRVKLDRVFCPSHVGPSFCNIKDEVLQEIRSLYYEHFSLGHAPPTKRIYVSRSKVKRRFVQNEQEVVDLLTKFGFEVVHFQDMSFYDQIKLASETELMIGLTGSGLNNMMFMQSGTKVLEFKMRQDFHNLHYFGFASGLRLPYYYLLCDTIGEVRYEANFVVDIPLLEKTIGSMIS